MPHLAFVHARQKLAGRVVHSGRMHHLHYVHHLLSLNVVIVKLWVNVEALSLFALQEILSHYSIDFLIVVENLLSRVRFAICLGTCSRLRSTVVFLRIQKETELIALVHTWSWSLLTAKS